MTINAGPLMLVNFKRGGSIYFGGGMHFGIDCDSYNYTTNVIGGGGRIGYKFNNGWYLFLELNYYGGNNNHYSNYYGGYYDHYSELFGNNTLFHIGYFFLTLTLFDGFFLTH